MTLDSSFSAGSSSYGPGKKRRKPTQLSAMTYLLDESDVLDDLKIINKNKAFSVSEPFYIIHISNLSSSGSVLNI